MYSGGTYRSPARNVQQSSKMRMWLAPPLSSTSWPLARAVWWLVTRHLPCNVARVISGAWARRSCLGNGAGANASGPIRASNARQRRTFIARLLSSSLLHGDDPGALGALEDDGAVLLVAPAIQHLHAGPVLADEADAADRLVLPLAVVEVQLGRLLRRIDRDVHRADPRIAGHERPAVLFDEDVGD